MRFENRSIAVQDLVYDKINKSRCVTWLPKPMGDKKKMMVSFWMSVMFWRNSFFYYTCLIKVERIKSNGLYEWQRRKWVKLELQIIKRMTKKPTKLLYYLNVEQRNYNCTCRKWWDLLLRLKACKPRQQRKQGKQLLLRETWQQRHCHCLWRWSLQR